MQKIKIKPGTLILLSGPSGSGKSTWAKSYNCVVSSDKVRTTLFGEKKNLVYEYEHHTPSDLNDKLVFDTMAAAVKDRLRALQTTIVDATLLNDKVRDTFAKLTTTDNVLVLAFTTPQESCKSNDVYREYTVGSKVIDKQFEKYVPQSKYKVIEVDLQDPPILELDLNELPNSQLDIIGDVHGNRDELVSLIRKLGYDHNYHHPHGRKLLFLGDIVDRGPDSVGCLKVVMGAVKSGNYCLLGNHEANLLKAIGELHSNSPSTSFTLDEVLRLSPPEVKEIENFLESLPIIYKYENYIFVHANITEVGFNFPFYQCVRGSTRYGETLNTDKIFSLFEPDKFLIRGHRPAMGTTKNVLSLEEGAGFGGPICAYRLDSKQIVREDTSWVFNPNKSAPHSKIPPKFIKTDRKDGMTLVKYSRKAFLKEVWNDYPQLLDLRGVVFDSANNRVTYPFPKLFNVWEKHCNLPDQSQILVGVEKINGFLGQCFYNPYTKKVQFASSGSLNSEHAKYLEELLWSKTKGLYDFLRVSRYTLLWEVLTRNLDEIHPIPHNSEDEVYLIGCGSFDGMKSEQELDNLANILGGVKRPKHEMHTFSTWQELNQNSTNEGYILRDTTSEQNYLCKLKSPYYLTIKAFMRSYPSKERNLEHISKDFPVKLWGKMSVVERRDFVINLLSQCTH